MSQRISQAIAAQEKVIRLPAGNQEIELVRLPPATFQLGSEARESGHRDVEGPVRRVAISRAFYIGRFEINQLQYAAVMGTNPSSRVGNQLAVDQITRARAREFCARLSKAASVEVTLPTEAQWEYACRAGTTTRFYSGDTQADLDRVAWWRGNSGGTVHPVGEKEPNGFGLHDMLGNVWEHCLDVLPDYRTIAGTDPVGPIEEDEGTMRGGGWMNDAEYCRAACGLRTDDRFGGCGIRVVVNL